MKIRIDIEYNGEHTTMFCRGTEVTELSKMIRGGRETGFSTLTLTEVLY